MMWFIESEALEEIKIIYSLAKSKDVSGLLSQSGNPLSYQVQDGTANISITGPLMARSNPLMSHFGMVHTGYDEIKQNLEAAELDPNVKNIVLNVDSPGGQADGLFEVTGAIKSLSKPSVAVAGHAASAAYAIAAATGRIQARGAASSFGSIGVAADFSVDEKTVTITSTNAPDKRPDIKTEEGKSVIRDQLDSMHELFVSDIGSSRGVSSEEINKGFGKGRSFLAKEARSRGMIDDIIGSNYAINNKNSQSANAERKENTMDLKTLKADHHEVFSAACDAAISEERDRVAAHLKMGESSGAMDTALKAVLDGSQMNQSLMAEYMSIGLKKRDQDLRQSEDSDAGAALSGKSESVDLETEQAAFDKTFAAELSELRGIQIDS